GLMGRDTVVRARHGGPDRGYFLGVSGAARGLVAGGRAGEPGARDRARDGRDAVHLGDRDADRGGRLLAAPALLAGGGAGRARAGDTPRRGGADRAAAGRGLVALGAEPAAPGAPLRSVAAACRARPVPGVRVARFRRYLVRRQGPQFRRHAVGAKPRAARPDSARRAEGAGTPARVRRAP